MSSPNFDAILKGASAYHTHAEKQILEAFRVFDDEGTGSIDVKYVEIIVRALGRVPRKSELKNFIKRVRDPDTKGLVKLEVLLPALRDILLKDVWQPASKEVLQAFEFFDQKKNGSLDARYIRELLTKHGDKFNDDEVERFLEFAVNPVKETIEYVSIYKKMAIPESLDLLEERRKLSVELSKELCYK